MLIKNKPIFYWLLSVIFFVVLMIIVGGLTRLFDAGLSMVNWHLFLDTIPPLTQQAWLNKFEVYKNFPEYNQYNKGMTLAEFKWIYFWEFIHRFIARILGLVFVLPFIYFLIKRKLSKSLLLTLCFALFLGTLQAFLGWYMVKSGLIDQPDVSHFRLAFHLITAFLIFVTLLRAIFLSINLKKTKKSFSNYYKISMFLLTLFIFIQIIYGAFMAGLKAGYAFNTWPKMGDYWIVPGALPVSLDNYLNNIFVINWFHRSLGILILVISIPLLLLLYQKFKSFTLSTFFIKGLAVSMFLQVFIGILTIIYIVPLPLASLHQINTLFILFFLTTCLYQMKLF